jgi:hypothetical protein
MYVCVYTDQCLKHLQIFEGLEPGIRSYCCQQMGVKLLRKTETTHQQFDKLDSVYVVLSGSFSVTYKEPDLNEMKNLKHSSVLEMCQVRLCVCVCVRRRHMRYICAYVLFIVHVLHGCMCTLPYTPQRMYHDTVKKETVGERSHRIQKEKDKNMCLFHSTPGA